MHRDLGLATEAELTELFEGCEPGAVPPIGAAFDIPSLVDDELLAQHDVWMEGGNHREVVHLSGDSFRALMADTPHGRFSQHL